jgi:hypothetical protein
MIIPWQILKSQGWKRMWIGTRIPRIQGPNIYCIEELSRKNTDMIYFSRGRQW